MFDTNISGHDQQSAKIFWKLIEIFFETEIFSVMLAQQQHPRVILIFPIQDKIQHQISGASIT